MGWWGRRWWWWWWGGDVMSALVQLPAIVERERGVPLPLFGASCSLLHSLPLNLFYYLRSDRWRREYAFSARAAGSSSGGENHVAEPEFT